MKFLMKGAKANPPSAYANNAVAFEALSIGKPEDGLSYSRTAHELDPENLTFRSVRASLMEATANYEEARKLRDESLAGKSWLVRLQRLATDIPLLVADHKTEEAESQVRALINEFGRSAEPETMKLIKSSLNGNLAYAKGDLKALQEVLDATDEENQAVYQLLAVGKVETASDRYPPTCLLYTSDAADE